MASASTTSARTLFADSKMRLADRVQVNVNNIASLARHMVRGSKSTEVISNKSHRYLAPQPVVSDADAFGSQLCPTGSSNREQREQFEKIAAPGDTLGVSIRFHCEVFAANRRSERTSTRNAAIKAV